MNHLEYYQYQAKARGITNLSNVIRHAEEKAYLYDRVVLPWLPEKKSGRISELACGHGSFLHWLKSRKFSNVTGIDSSAEQIQFARQVGVTVNHEDVLRWLTNQASESFDSLVAIDLIEHLAKDDFMELLRLARLALAPGGCLVLRFPNGDSPLVGMNLFNDITHVWTYTPNCLQSLAAMHGFSRVEFNDESADAIRDHRWLKVRLSKLSAMILKSLFHAATREKIGFLSPHLWAKLTK